jgi:hypothetical protein
VQNIYTGLCSDFLRSKLKNVGVESAELGGQDKKNGTSKGQKKAGSTLKESPFEDGKAANLNHNKILAGQFNKNDPHLTASNGHSGSRQGKQSGVKQASNK